MANGHEKAKPYKQDGSRHSVGPYLHLRKLTSQEIDAKINLLFNNNCTSIQLILQVVETVTWVEMLYTETRNNNNKNSNFIIWYMVVYL